MAQDIINSSDSLVEEAMAAFPKIDVNEAMLVGGDTHVFVDLREGAEQAKTGRIPGAVAGGPLEKAGT